MRRWINWSVLSYLYAHADQEEKPALIKQYRLGFDHSYIDDAPFDGMQWNITPGTQLAMRVPATEVDSPVAAMTFALFVKDIPNDWSADPTFQVYEENGVLYIEMTVHPD